jgi:hypothetical protein
MTPKEKATNLVEKFDSTLTYLESKVKAKQLALIVIDEILEVIEFNKYDDKYWEEEEYWNEVKQEIQAL